MAAVTDIGLARLASLEEKIGESEQDGLRARWEFGRELVAARDGKGRLPNGYLAKVVEETGASRAELKRRAQFAERFPTEDELAHAVSQFRSWHEIVNDILPAQSEPATFYGKGDKWSESTEPLTRYLKSWEKRGFEFAHVNPHEANKRVERIDNLIAGLEAARADLEPRKQKAKLTL